MVSQASNIHGLTAENVIVTCALVQREAPHRNDTRYLHIEVDDGRVELIFFFVNQEAQDAFAAAITAALANPRVRS